MNKSLMRRPELVAWHYVGKKLGMTRYDIYASILVSRLVEKFQKELRTAYSKLDT